MQKTVKRKRKFCDVCGTLFRPTGNFQRYCGSACKRVHDQKAHHEHYLQHQQIIRQRSQNYYVTHYGIKRGLDPRPCEREGCETVYKPNRPVQRYCSKACRLLVKNAHSREKRDAYNREQENALRREKWRQFQQSHPYTPSGRKYILREETYGQRGWFVWFPQERKSLGKYFGDKHYGGAERSLEAAIKYRDRTAKKYHFMIVEDRVILNTLRYSNKTGVSGVSIGEDYFLAGINIRPGKTKNKKFRIKTRGEEEAFRLAVEWRKDMELSVYGQTHIIKPISEYWEQYQAHKEHYEQSGTNGGGETLFQ